MAQAIPVNGDGTFDEPTWGESGAFSDSAYEGTGCPNGTLVGPNDFNQPRKHSMRWIRALRDRQFPSDQGLFDSCMIKGGSWNVSGGTLDGTLTVSWVMIDASDDGGVVVELAIGAGSPHTFTASRDTYVNLNESGAVEYQEVPNSDPAPTPSAGYVAVWKIVTDGSGLTSATVLIPTVPTVKAMRATGAVNIEGTVTCEGALAVTGNMSLGGTVTGAFTCEYIVATGNALFLPTIEVQATSGAPSISATGNGTASASQAAIVTNGSTGYALRATASGGSPAVSVAHTGSGTGISVSASVGSGIAGDFTGGNGAGGYAVQGTATHNDASALRGSTASGASVTAYGVEGRGGGASGSGVLGIAFADGYGVVAQSDTTTPARAAARLVPQDADPVSAQQGDLLFQSSRGPTGKLRTRTTQWESVHSSAKGHVWAIGSAASGSILAGNSSDLSLAQITPEETGVVEVLVTGHLDWSSDAGSALIQLRDDTTNTTINGGGSGVQEYPIVGAVGRDHSFVARIPYTLPSTATRTFGVRITAAGATVTYTDVVVSVIGVQ